MYPYFPPANLLPFSLSLLCPAPTSSSRCVSTTARRAHFLIQSGGGLPELSAPPRNHSERYPCPQRQPFIAGEVTGNIRDNFHQNHHESYGDSYCGDEPFTQAWAHLVIRCASSQPSDGRHHRAYLRNGDQNRISQKHACRGSKPNAQHRHRWCLIKRVHSGQAPVHQPAASHSK